MDVPILSLNLGLPKIIGQWHGQDVLSGFDKQPVDHESVFVSSMGIEGDGQVDLENHGGADKAVYAYPAIHWPWWQKEKQLACRPGLFGENLTLGALDETNVHLGDRFSWGDVILEISQPRAPCYKLGVYTHRPELPSVMTVSGRCGWYFRVLQEGNVSLRGMLTRVVCADAPSVRDAFAAVFTAKSDFDLLQRIHAAPAISPAWQQQVEKRLRAAQC